MFNKVEERLINAYVVLIMGNRRILEDAPINLRSEIELRIAEKEVEILQAGE